jgi:hypothetical protein
MNSAAQNDTRPTKKLNRFRGSIRICDAKRLKVRQIVRLADLRIGRSDDRSARIGRTTLSKRLAEPQRVERRGMDIAARHCIAGAMKLERGVGAAAVYALYESLRREFPDLPKPQAAAA